jgi:phycoerythrin-associated linker protein
MTLANAAYLGIERFANDRNKENWTNATENDKAALIRAVYKQVLGNQYVMASERLEGPESLFKRGYLSVREFVRQVAKSGLYKAKFFENCNAYRFIELNFKHLLGRAPQNKAEMLHHFTILQEQGYDAEIDSYLDSAEYQNRFGEELVPYLHGWDYNAGQQGLQFSYMLQLARGVGASVRGDALKTQSRLNPAVHAEQPMSVVSPNAKGAVFRKVSTDGVTRQGVGGSEEGRTFRVEITGFNNYRLHKRSNRVRFIPFDKLLQYQQQIHREGGRIASITPVNERSSPHEGFRRHPRHQLQQWPPSHIHCDRPGQQRLLPHGGSGHERALHPHERNHAHGAAHGRQDHRRVRERWRSGCRFGSGPPQENQLQGQTGRVTPR